MGRRNNYQPLKSQLNQGKWARFCRYWSIRLLRLQGHPKEIARGLAVGVFAGFFPWFGFQMVVALALAILLRGNKIAAATSTWVSNPLTYIPIFAFNYKIGKLLIGWSNTSAEQSNFQADFHSLSHFMEMGTDLILNMFVGCFAVGMIAALVTYFASLRLLKRWHEIRHFQKVQKRQ